MVVGKGKHKRRADARAIIELEGATVKNIAKTAKNHLRIVIERDGVEAVLITAENSHGRDRTWSAKFRADVRKALSQGST